MDHLEDNPEQNAGIGWLFGVLFAGLSAVSCFAAAGVGSEARECCNYGTAGPCMEESVRGEAFMTKA